MIEAVYETSHIKRIRATNSEVEERREALETIVALGYPMTVRQVFYQASVRGIIDKSEAGYNKVQVDLVHLRRSGRIPYGWITDGTRRASRLQAFSSIQEALEDTAHFYRKRLWNEIDAYVEIWLEKDALSGVINPVTLDYDVTLMVARGYASLSFLHSAAEEMAEMEKPIYVYHLGDFDPSGVNAGEKIEQTLKEMAPLADITFERLAVTPDQIRSWNLPTRPTKKSDTRSKNFGEICVELDAITPEHLRGIVRDAIERHMPPDTLDILRQAEESEQLLIKGLVGMALNKGAPDGGAQ